MYTGAYQCLLVYVSLCQSTLIYISLHQSTLVSATLYYFILVYIDLYSSIVILKRLAVGAGPRNRRGTGKRHGMAIGIRRGGVVVAIRRPHGFSVVGTGPRHSTNKQCPRTAADRRAVAGSMKSRLYSVSTKREHFPLSQTGACGRRLPRLTGEPTRPTAAALRIARRTIRPRTSACQVGRGGVRRLAILAATVRQAPMAPPEGSLRC